MSRFDIDRLPVLGICGYSGAGKTTLAEALIATLRIDGLRVAAVKHDAHGLDFDRQGKDSDRFFRAGATVAAQGPGETFIRWPSDRAPGLLRLVADLSRDHDLVLVEGHKRTPLPARVWLERRARDAPPADCGPMTLRLPRSADRVHAVLSFVREWLPEQCRRIPVSAGILIGGASRRMGRPKQSIRVGGFSWLRRIHDAVAPCVETTVALGAGPIPDDAGGIVRLPDPTGFAGPVAGMVAAMRWSPRSSWLFVPCDVPLITREAVRWLLDQRAPGRRAILPFDPDHGRLHPLPAWYDGGMLDRLETCDRPSALDGLPGVHRAPIPPGLRAAWSNVNTAQQWRGVRKGGAVR